MSLLQRSITTIPRKPVALQTRSQRTGEVSRHRSPKILAKGGKPKDLGHLR